MDLEKLENTFMELEQNSKQLKSFLEVYSEISELRADIEKNAALLHGNNEDLKKLKKELGSHLISSSEKLTQIDSYLQNKIEELYKDNKNYQKELDGLLISKLNSHKSDIEVAIVNQSKQSQTAFENAMVSNFNRLEDKMKSSQNRLEEKLQKNTETQANHLNNLKTLAYIAIGLSTIIGLGLMKFML